MGKWIRNKGLINKLPGQMAGIGAEETTSSSTISDLLLFTEYKSSMVITFTALSYSLTNNEDAGAQKMCALHPMGRQLDNLQEVSENMYLPPARLPNCQQISVNM